MRLPLVYPYTRFESLLKKHGELSLRKQFCFAYITWGYKSDKKAKERFVELAKEWRAEEGRVGQPRTLLERKARKLFQTVAKRKKLAPSREGAKEWATKSRERKVGVHSPEYQAKLREHNKKIRQIQKEKGLVGGTKDWIVYSPDGQVYHTRGLRNFCEEMGLKNEPMYRTNKNPGTTWNGWWAESMDNEWKNL